MKRHSSFNAGQHTTADYQSSAVNTYSSLAIKLDCARLSPQPNLSDPKQFKLEQAQRNPAQMPQNLAHATKSTKDLHQISTKPSDQAPAGATQPTTTKLQHYATANTNSSKANPLTWRALLPACLHEQSRPRISSHKTKQNKTNRFQIAARGGAGREQHPPSLGGEAGGRA